MVGSVNTHSIRHGSSKDVIIPTSDASPEEIKLRFTRRFSVFDVGPVPYEIEDMDVLRHAIAVKMFEVLKIYGMPTHFRGADFDELTISVEPFDIDEIGQRFDSARGRIIPLEIIDRLVLTQPVLDRARTNPELRSKIMKCTASTTAVGMPFSTPLIECTTKFEPIDRKLLDAQAVEEAQLGWTSYFELCVLIERASRIVTRFFDEHGFKRMDGKWEVAMTYKNSSFILADSYSPDEMRLIGPDGRSYDKDPLRNWYTETFPEWIRELEAAKKAWPNDKSRWPAYPPDVPPDAVLMDLRDRYAAVAKAIRAI